MLEPHGARVIESLGTQLRGRCDRTRIWLYQFAGAGERLVLSNEAVLDVDAIFAGVFELPGD